MNFSVKKSGVAGLEKFGATASNQNSVASFEGSAIDLAHSTLQGDIVFPAVIAEVKNEATVQSGMKSKPLAPR